MVPEKLAPALAAATLDPIALARAAGFPSTKSWHVVPGWVLSTTRGADQPPVSPLAISSRTTAWRLGKFTTIASWVLRARTTTASSSSDGFSSR